MIYILTVYDSLNYGSYWQAIALQHELEQYGEVYFMDINHQSTFQQCLKKVAGHVAKKRFKGIWFEFSKWKIFKDCLAPLQIISMNHMQATEEDVYVFGSDEIWNISRKKFLKSPEFWGIGLKHGQKISYAPSINTATKEEYENHEELTDSLKGFWAISVRDEYSRSVLTQFLDKPVEVVLDPTFLYGVDNFKKIEKKPNIIEPYIMIYTYGKMCRTEQQIISIKEVAKKRNLKIISVGKYLKWADESINTIPQGFLGYVDGAECVITDTFHGTVFSVLYRKNFVVVDPANKIIDLLNDFGLTSCVIDDVSELENVIDLKTDYLTAEVVQQKYVEFSKCFLREHLTYIKSIEGLG